MRNLVQRAKDKGKTFETKSRFEKHNIFKHKMPRRREVNKRGMKTKVPFCRFCLKMLTLKEGELHFFVCDKVPQEIFNGSSLKVAS